MGINGEGSATDRPARDRDFPRFFLSHRNDAQSVHEVLLALRSSHAAFPATVTNFC